MNRMVKDHRNIQKKLTLLPRKYDELLYLLEDLDQKIDDHLDEDNKKMYR